MKSDTFDFRAARFTVAAHEPGQWPPDTGREIAFAGRSNVGKSSAINTVTGRRGLARTSKTPGRTQQIVFFELDADRRLVDLPGYGYARVPDAVRHHWAQTVERYLAERSSLQGLVVAMDSRRPLTPLDRQMLKWSAARGLPVHILLTKADKLSRTEASAILRHVEAELGGGSATSVQLFSARTRAGVEQARAVVSAWLEPRAK